MRHFWPPSAHARFKNRTERPLKFGALALLTLFLTAPLLAQDANPILEELRPQLQAAISEQVPDAVWEVKGNELTASYKTRVANYRFLEPNGKLSEQARLATEPQENGFILRARVFSSLPAFAVQNIIGERIYSGHYSLRASDELTTDFSQPALLAEEQQGWANFRTETLDMPAAYYSSLRRLQAAGLVKDERLESLISRAPKPNRYETSIMLARFYDAFPGLKGRKAERIQTLRGLVADKKLSEAQIESLDHEMRELRSELSGELTAIGMKFDNGLEVRSPTPRNQAVKRASGAQYLVVTFAKGPSNGINTHFILDTIEKSVRARNEATDDR